MEKGSSVKHVCEKEIGWEIIYSIDDKSWWLLIYWPQGVNGGRKSRIILPSEEDWKNTGFFNLGRKAKIKIKYCPFCGQRLENTG